MKINIYHDKIIDGLLPNKWHFLFIRICTIAGLITVFLVTIWVWGIIKYNQARFDLQADLSRERADGTIHPMIKGACTKFWTQHTNTIKARKQLCELTPDEALKERIK